MDRMRCVSCKQSDCNSYCRWLKLSSTRLLHNTQNDLTTFKVNHIDVDDSWRMRSVEDFRYWEL